MKPYQLAEGDIPYVQKFIIFMKILQVTLVVPGVRTPDPLVSYILL